MSEAVHGGGELSRDARVEVAGVQVERPHCRLDLASELLEHEVLVLHLGHESGGLEQALSVRVGDGQRWVEACATDGAVGRVEVGAQCALAGWPSVFETSSTRRSCSWWKTWWIVESAMFSLHRPSPQVKWSLSISSSYVPGAW